LQVTSPKITLRRPCGRLRIQEDKPRSHTHLLNRIGPASPTAEAVAPVSVANQVLARGALPGVVVCVIHGERGRFPAPGKLSQWPRQGQRSPRTSPRRHLPPVSSISASQRQTAFQAEVHPRRGSTSVSNGQGGVVPSLCNPSPPRSRHAASQLLKLPRHLQPRVRSSANSLSQVKGPGCGVLILSGTAQAARMAIPGFTQRRASHQIEYLLRSPRLSNGRP
jgi:hypothetical protein